MNRRAFLEMALLFLAGCAVPPDFAKTLNPLSSPSPDTTGTPQPTVQPTACRPQPLVAPTQPAATPGPDLYDPSSGLHVTASKVMQLDPQTYRLKVSGLVEHPLELTLDELRCLPKMTAKVNLTCKGYFEDVTTYSGARLADVLRLSGVKPGAQSLDLNGADGYSSYVALADAVKEDTFLAYQWKDEPIPVLHGFPVRAVIATSLGYAWTKLLVEIVVK